MPHDHATGMPHNHATGMPHDHATGPHNHATGMPHNHATGPHDHATGMPHDHATGMPHNHATGMPHNHATSAPHNHATGMPHDHATGQHSKAEGHLVTHEQGKDSLVLLVINPTADVLHKIEEQFRHITLHVPLTLSAMHMACATNALSAPRESHHPLRVL